MTVHYSGSLLDGRIFDSSIQRGQPTTFKVGEVIEGWNEALVEMSVGEKRTLIIPPDLGYGTMGYPGVIPRLNADLRGRASGRAVSEDNAMKGKEIQYVCSQWRGRASGSVAVPTAAAGIPSRELAKVEVTGKRAVISTGERAITLRRSRWTPSSALRPGLASWTGSSAVG